MEDRWCLCDWCLAAIKSRGERIASCEITWEDMTEEENETEMVKCDWCEDVFDMSEINVCERR